MDPTKLDPQLLLVVEAIHRLGSLTAAGEALGLSQPAVSLALKRMRATFGDALFVRTSRGVRPTPKADEIAAGARRLITFMRREFGSAGPLSPAAMERVFTICMSDVGQMVFLPKLLERLRREAPRCDVAAVTLTPRNLEEALHVGTVDLAIGYLPDLSGANIEHQRLFERGYLCLASTRHPRLRGRSITLDDFLHEAHLVVASESRIEERCERYLKEEGLQRRVLLSVPHMLCVPMIVSTTDLVATVPQSAGIALSRYPGIKAHAPPMKPPQIPIAQHWSARFANDPAIAWLRGLVGDVFRETGESFQPAT